MTLSRNSKIIIAAFAILLLLSPKDDIVASEVIKADNTEISTSTITSVVTTETETCGTFYDTTSNNEVIVEWNGFKLKEELCDDLRSMFNAAKSDGITLSATSSYRTVSEQKDLRIQNCPDIDPPDDNGNDDVDMFTLAASGCSPPTAIPGNSRHNLGDAIDFKLNTIDGVCTSDSTFNWLIENAPDYGFYNNLVDQWECWHFSSNGY